MSRLTLVTFLGRIVDNAREIRKKLSPGTKMIAVVKANAYGHGSVQVAKALEQNALAEAFAVATPGEGACLREAGITLPVIVLGYADKSDMRVSVKYGLSQTVYSDEMLAALSECAAAAGKTASAQLKIDTGMNRIGVKGERALRLLLEKWQGIDNVFMHGMFSHFSSADSDEQFTLSQKNAFLRAEQTVRQYGFSPIRHISASSALTEREFSFDAVRAGIILYGACAQAFSGAIQPCQKLYTHPVRIECVREGESVGYSRAFRAKRDMSVMTIPCGYGDGYSRLLSGKAQVLVNGMRAPVIGNICMDMMMCDITGIPNVTMESEVVLLGEQADMVITPEELASLQETIPYEIMLGFSERVEKQWAE